MLLGLLLFTTAEAAGAAARLSSLCLEGSDYAKALCAYDKEEYAEAEGEFMRLAEREEASPEVIRSMYFLARTKMQLHKFDEAHALLIRIYSIDPGFYKEWACDFLLGECRKALGRD
jgi:outer membrane protein assembly factor BamD (BamD/ComL family)